VRLSSCWPGRTGAGAAAPADAEAGWQDLEADEAMTQEALAILRAGEAGAYEAAVAALREDTRAWWTEQLTWKASDYEKGEAPYRPTAADLRRFLETEVTAAYEETRRELEQRPLLRSQVFG
jgi:hypothetical protein